MEKLIIPSILSISDVVYLGENILKVTKPLTDADPKLSTLHTMATSINNRLVKNQKNSKKSGLTSKKQEKDQLRDQGIKSFDSILHGITISLIPEMAAPASELYAILEKYGTIIYALGYKAESSILKSLFDEYDSEANQQKLTTIGILPYYNALKQAEDNFIVVSDDDTNQKATIKANTEPATDIAFGEMVPTINKIVTLMQLNNELEPEIYSEAFNKMVTIITEVNTTARSRSTRNEKPEPEPVE